MRILLANDGIGLRGGIEAYVNSIADELVRRGHDLALLSYDSVLGTKLDLPPNTPVFSVQDSGLRASVAAAARWQPDICFSQNIGILEVEELLLDTFPVAKFMHGYLGTCISGYKLHTFPGTVCCERRFGPACLALFLPRHCGELSLSKMVAQYRWAARQNALLDRYTAIIVASDHMKREYMRHDVSKAKLHAIPLFPTIQSLARIDEKGREGEDVEARESRILFLGRMTSLKGGDFLIRAIALANQQLGKDIILTMAGDGPQRTQWLALARSLQVHAEFPGWLEGDARLEVLCQATLLAVPSLWPEPFGLVGLEAAAVGVPSVAFDVGGIPQWLHDGVNGRIVPGKRPNVAALANVVMEVLGDSELLKTLKTGAFQIARTMGMHSHVERLEAVLTGAA